MKSRTPDQMRRLILDTARGDGNILAVVLNGSRADPAARQDIFQDFDIVFLVERLAPFLEDNGWIDRFGERLVMQMPDRVDGLDPAETGRQVWLIQFADGCRLDLTVTTPDRYDRGGGEPAVVLYDPGSILPPIPAPTGHEYDLRPPAAADFAGCVNEFWWLVPYAAKGLWRQELPLVRQMMECHLRGELERMLGWLAGCRNGFSVSAGKMNRYLPRYLTAAEWARYRACLPDAGEAAAWAALFAMTELFESTADQVAAAFSFPAPTEDGDAIRRFLAHVRALPRDAGAIYP